MVFGLTEPTRMGKGINGSKARMDRLSQLDLPLQHLDP
jgi:hypothetical protein